MQDTVNIEIMQSYYMQYSVYAVPGINSCSGHGEIEREYFTLCSWVIVELRTRMREMRGDGGHHLGKLGLMRNLFASKITIPDLAGITPSPHGMNIKMGNSINNLATCTPYFSYPLVSSILFPFSSLISLSCSQLY